jgi:hypothetical protein
MRESTVSDPVTVLFRGPVSDGKHGRAGSVPNWGRQRGRSRHPGGYATVAQGNLNAALGPRYDERPAEAGRPGVSGSPSGDGTSFASVQVALGQSRPSRGRWQGGPEFSPPCTMRRLARQRGELVCGAKGTEYPTGERARNLGLPYGTLGEREVGRRGSTALETQNARRSGERRAIRDYMRLCDGLRRIRLGAAGTRSAARRG